MAEGHFKCKFCGASVRWRVLKGKRVPIHESGSCAAYVRKRLQGTQLWRSTTHRTTCQVCGRRCYFYQNQHGSKVFFDFLGPPWKKHDCFSHPAPKPSRIFDWVREGYAPCEIYEIEVLPARGCAVVYVMVHLDSGSSKRLTLRLDARELKAFIQHLHQPFVFLEIGAGKFELNTYDWFYTRLEPRSFFLTEAMPANSWIFRQVELPGT
jgi:hypothetical protein